MLNQSLIALVNSVLGTGKQTASGNYAYHCPFCNHHKPKLEVNMKENTKGDNPWHCWVCDKKGRKLYQLFKQVSAPQEKMSELRAIVKYTGPETQIETKEVVQLPKEFKTFDNIRPSDIEGKHALAYLKSRGITEEDIIKYNIGYCTSGTYKNMVIIPSYNSEGQLNYFTGRSFEKDPYTKYKNPEISRDIIPNEHLINWSLPLVICEGMFDAIAIKRNAIPLLGKNIQSELRKKIVTSTIKKIYIALDTDAMKQAIRFAEEFLNEGKEVYLIDLKGKDPSEIGFSNFTNLIQNTYPLTSYQLMERKLQLI